MAVGVSTAPIPTIILRHRLCVPLSPSASSPASLPFLRPQSRQRSPVSMSRAGDSSSSASCPPTGQCIRIFPLAFIIPSFSPVRFDAYLRMLSLEGMLRCLSDDWAPVVAVIAIIIRKDQFFRLFLQ